MTRNVSRCPPDLYTVVAVGPRVRILIHDGGVDGYRPRELLLGHRFTRHLLRGCTLSLRAKDGGRLCPHGGVRELVSSDDGSYYEPLLAKGPILLHICGRESDVFSDAFSGIGRNASSVLGLSGHVLLVKLRCQHRIVDLGDQRIAIPSDLVGEVGQTPQGYQE